MIKLNGTELSFETFPNGETRVNGDQITSNTYSHNKIDFKYENDSDLIKLMFVKNYLDDINKSTSLKIYYMPYSRMDRVEGNSVFTLKYVSALINSLNFVSIEIVEPHSDATTNLIDKSFASYPTIDLLEKVISKTNFDKSIDYLFFPDDGAQKRYANVHGYQQLVGHKVREFKTGKITSLDVEGDVKHKNFKAIIVDDLCSYGGTFILSAEKLRALGASKIYLLVAHTEYSIYKGKIIDSDLIDMVFTTDSILNNSEHEKVFIYEIGGN